MSNSILRATDRSGRAILECLTCGATARIDTPMPSGDAVLAMDRFLSDHAHDEEAGDD